MSDPSINTYTQFVTDEGTDDENIVWSVHGQQLVISAGTSVYIGRRRYMSNGSTVHIDPFNVAVIVDVSEDPE